MNADPTWFVPDQQAARAEMTQKYGGQYGEHANAEDLIVAHRMTKDPALRQVGFLGVDEAETNDLDLAALGKQYDIDGDVLSAAVRGEAGKPRAVVIVYEDRYGRTRKRVEAFDSEWKRPALSPAEAAMRARFEHEQRVRGDIDGLVQDAEARIAEAAAAIERQTQESIARMQAESSKRLQAAMREQGLDPDASVSEPGAQVQPGDDMSEKPSPQVTYPEGTPHASVALIRDGDEDNELHVPTPLPSEEGEGGEEERDTEPGEWPRRHAALDEYAESRGVEFDDSMRTLDDKIAYMESQGIQPPPAEGETE